MKENKGSGTTALFFSVTGTISFYICVLELFRETG